MGSAEGLVDEILVALRRIIRAIDLHSRVLVQRHGLTGPQLVVLRALNLRDEIPVGRLAKQVSLSHATVTGILDRLEQRGLIQKKPDIVDKRRVLIRITESGRQKVEAAPLILQERFAAELLQLQEWEQTLILSSLQRLGTMMGVAETDVEPLLVTDSAGATSETSKGLLQPLGTRQSSTEDST